MSSSLPWSLRRFLPHHPETHNQTPTDRASAQTDPAQLDEFLAHSAVKYDQPSLKGDGTPTLVWTRPWKRSGTANPDGGAFGTFSPRGPGLILEVIPWFELRGSGFPIFVVYLLSATLIKFARVP